MISTEELKALTLAVKKRYGLDFTNYEARSLRRGIIRLMNKHKMEGMTDLWGKVLRDDEFFMNNIDDLLVNLTELFRNPDAWMMIRDEVLPQFRKSNEIDIWHAGCSTGEEIYTMGIVLEESNMLFKSNILASDLSQTALSKARQGVYSKAAMKNYLKPFMKFFPDRSMEDYFDFSQAEARIKSRYTKKIQFLKHNLVGLKMDKKFDIIFCRNVMIYFDNELKSRVLKFLDGCLKEGGFLILGYYDTMPNQSIDIFDVLSNSTRIYKKRLTLINEAYEQESINCG